MKCLSAGLRIQGEQGGRHRLRSQFREPIEDTPPSAVKAARLDQSLVQGGSKRRVAFQRQPLLQKDGREEMEAGVGGVIACRLLDGSGTSTPSRSISSRMPSTW